MLTVAPGQTDPERLLELARELAGQGRYGEAVHQVVLAALSTTERAGLVRFRSGLTLQDYLRALASSRPVAWNSLKRMARVFEPVFFGNHAASREMVEQVLEDYTEGFEAIDAPHPN
ncbi:MAG: DUF4129 domain-containing protein [Planctomycetaceae bacterium]|nr:DUF4129 domain-containing protein [Planctomycetaceae bacterium]